MLDDRNLDSTSDEPHRTLHRLAEALDIAPTAFFNATVSELSQTVELLRFWHGITDGQDRLKVLAYVQFFAPRA